MRSLFKEEHSFEKRKEDARRIRCKYPDRIPVICERVENSKIPCVDKKKYLVPHDLTMGQFIYVIRKRIHLPAEKGFFMYLANGTVPPSSAPLSLTYDQHKDEDGFLYIKYSGENTFGLFS